MLNFAICRRSGMLHHIYFMQFAWNFCYSDKENRLFFEYWHSWSSVLWTAIIITCVITPPCTFFLSNVRLSSILLGSVQFSCFRLQFFHAKSGWIRHARYARWKYSVLSKCIAKLRYSLRNRQHFKQDVIRCTAIQISTTNFSSL